MCSVLLCVDVLLCVGKVLCCVYASLSVTYENPCRTLEMFNFDGLLGKINRSDLSSEAKTLMNLMVDTFRECNLEKNDEINSLKDKVYAQESTGKNGK